MWPRKSILSAYVFFYCFCAPQKSNSSKKAVCQNSRILTHRLGFCSVGGDQRYFSPNARWASFTICLMRCSSDFGQMRSTSPASATI